MNWKAEAIYKLKKYSEMKCASKTLPQEIDRLDNQQRCIESSKNHTSDQLLEIIAERQELAWSLNNVHAWLMVVDRALGCLDPEERLILHRLYIEPQRGGIKKLQDELGYEQSTVYRHRDVALEHFTRALYGCTER